MSPASQGTLEVERYIGSCLISSSAACNSGSHKSKKVPDNGGSRTGARTSGGVADAAAVATCQDHHFNIYHPTNSIVSLCECGNFKFGAGRYGSPAVGGNWAGLPLISMAPPNSRRNRKANKNTKVSYSNQQVIVNRSGEHVSRTPLSRLAIHTQGAPLILSGRYSGRKTTSGTKDTAVRQPREDTAARRNCGATNSNNSTPSSDCLSVASDESSGHSENSLPRIIKPRKRRKKDRKAPPPENKIDEVENSDIQSPSIVTLRPYVPLCYDIYDGGRHNESRWSLTKEDVERKVKVWEIENKHSYRLPYVIEVQADDEGVSHASDDDSLEPNLQHNFDEVEEDEGLLLETNTSFPYHFPTTHCHCRYCDPSGLIWDIDQHYYSPLLTPPSLTSANVPLYFSPSTAAMLSLDFLNNDIKHSPSHTLFMESNSHAGLLHRSWSEPLYSKLSGTEHSDEGSESDFGCRRLSHSKYSAKCSESLNENASTKGTAIPAAMNMFPSQSLEVSTEIVTSPNGHRDIEIKFYSSSPPAEIAVLSVDDHDTAKSWPNVENGSDNAVDCCNSTHTKDSKLCQLWKVPLQCSASVSDMCSVALLDEDQSAKKLGEEVGQLHLNGEEHETNTESVKK